MRLASLLLEANGVPPFAFECDQKKVMAGLTRAELLLPPLQLAYRTVPPYRRMQRQLLGRV